MLLNKYHAITSIVMMLLLASFVILISESGRFESEKTKIRDRAVPAGMLDYGEKGKILKHLGLVYGVRDNRLRPDSVDDWFPGDSLFKRKRKISDYAYLANPGNVYQLPSTAIIEADSFREGWPLISVVIDQPALTDADIGIATNPVQRGKDWERRATASYFENGKLRFASNVGIRVHGSNHDREIRTNILNNSYRLYFRNLYGVRELPPGTVFDGDKGTRRMVIRKERLFAAELAFDIARRLGVETPEYKPAIFYLNGKKMGIRTLSEQLSVPQWEARTGHENFYFFKYKGTTDADSNQAYRKLGRWYRQNRKMLDMKMAGQHIDIRNLTRNLFSFMFCGTNDWYQGAGVLDRNDPDARWHWVIWDMDESFRDNWKTSKGELWEQDALAQVIVANSKTSYWRVTYGNLRSELFSRLMNNDPRYRQYFLRTVTDALNHELTPEFFNERFAYYDKAIEQYRDSISKKELKQYEQVRQFVKYRPDFVRASMQRRFSQTRFELGELYTVSFNSLRPDMEYVVDGYPVRGSYTGKYFGGQRIEIKGRGGSAEHNWIVNGESIGYDVLDISVESDLIIEIIP